MDFANGIAIRMVNKALDFLFLLHTTKLLFPELSIIGECVLKANLPLEGGNLYVTPLHYFQLPLTVLQAQASSGMPYDMKQLSRCMDTVVY